MQQLQKCQHPWYQNEWHRLPVSMAKPHGDYPYNPALQFLLSVSPLKPADDAIHFDTTGVGIIEVVNFIEEKAKKILDK